MRGRGSLHYSVLQCSTVSYYYARHAMHHREARTRQGYALLANERCRRKHLRDFVLSCELREQVPLGPAV